jgi:hypothetical protein
MTESERPAARRIPVRYDGMCADCGTRLPRGTPAMWDSAAKRLTCVKCPRDAIPAPAAGPIAEVRLPPIDAGVAGGSARTEYERRHGRRETEVKGRWGERLGGLILRFSDEPQSIRAWGIGARGEEELAATFDGVEGLRILNDRRVKGTKGNIDHVLVAPAGVFVVDAKNYTGDVEIRNVGGWFRTELRLYVGGRDRSKLADQMGWQLTEVRAAIGASGMQPMPPVTPVLCFIGARWPRFRRIDEFEGVRVEDPPSLRKLIVEPVVLDEAGIEQVARTLAVALPAKLS